MLATESYTLHEAIDEIGNRIDVLEDEAEDLNDSTDKYQALQNRIDRLAYFRNGLEWGREEWGGDATIELGALTAGEKALMHREAPDDAEKEEMKLWYVAAATSQGPYAGDNLTDTFRNVSGLHPGFTAWAEAAANGLTVFGGTEGNGDRSST